MSKLYTLENHPGHFELIELVPTVSGHIMVKFRHIQTGTFKTFNIGTLEKWLKLKLPDETKRENKNIEDEDFFS